MASEINDARNGQGKIENIFKCKIKIHRRIDQPEKLIKLEIIDFNPEDIRG